MALPELREEEYERMKSLRDDGINLARGEGDTFIEYVSKLNLGCPLPQYTSGGCDRCKVLFPHMTKPSVCPIELYSSAGYVRRWNKLMAKYEIDNGIEPKGV